MEYAFYYPIICNNIILFLLTQRVDLGCVGYIAAYGKHALIRIVTDLLWPQQVISKSLLMQLQMTALTGHQHSKEAMYIILGILMGVHYS